MVAEVPRRLPPTSDERVKAVVDTVASGSLGGSTLFARKPETDVRSASRAMVPSQVGKEVFVEPWDDALADRGFDFVTVDPDGAYPPPP